MVLYIYCDPELRCVFPDGEQPGWEGDFGDCCERSPEKGLTEA
jgi:hypothetical protein